MMGSTGLVIGELRLLLTGFSGKLMASFGNGGGLAGGLEEAGGKTLAKFGMSVGLAGCEPCGETGGCGRGLDGGDAEGEGLTNGPESALAGDGDRLPGIGSRLDTLPGGDLD